MSANTMNTKRARLRIPGSHGERVAFWDEAGCIGRLIVKWKGNIKFKMTLIEWAWDWGKLDPMRLKRVFLCVVLYTCALLERDRDFDGNT